MQIARNYLSPTIRRVSLLARIMPLPVALSPLRSPPFPYLTARVTKPCVPRTGTIRFFVLFRFFEEAYRHLRFSRMTDHGLGRIDNVVDIVLFIYFFSLFFRFLLNFSNNQVPRIT